MTEYKENVWYGWNGGECPVHHKSTVEYVYLDEHLGPCLCKDEASNFSWLNNDGLPIVSFRVIKEYKEPREFWLLGNYAHDSKHSARMAKDISLRCRDLEITHVREVLD